REWKYIFLYLTCINFLLFFISGCFHFSKKQEGRQLLEEAMDQMVKRQYAASLENNLAVLDNYPPDLTDQALFQLGLLYAQPDYPQQDYKKALGAFNRIITEFPASQLYHQSHLWIRIINDIIDKNKESRALGSANISLEKTVKQQKIELALLQKKIDANKNTDLVISLEKIIDEQKDEINQLLEQIEKLKRVDLGIEEKKQKILLQDENIEEKNNGKDSGS
ncbi:MAG: hypothetical protein PVF37_08320, partial [Desulfobacterales bacterium]